MKLFITDMPFIVRIGYVFIVLAILFIGLSLCEKRHKAPSTALSPEMRRKDIRLGMRIIAAAAAVGVIAACFLRQFSTFALDSLYVLVVGFILVGIVLITNAKRTRMDDKALIVERKIFKTSLPFNLFAIGICGVLVFLYYYFW